MYEYELVKVTILALRRVFMLLISWRRKSER